MSNLMMSNQHINTFLLSTIHRRDSAHPAELSVTSSGANQVQMYDEVDNRVYCSLELNRRGDGHEYSQDGLEVRMLASIFVMGFL